MIYDILYNHTLFVWFKDKILYFRYDENNKIHIISGRPYLLFGDLAAKQII
ncbi:hypothetical protein GCM10007028_20160 [Algibacter mikhailovii]|uniref:Uncharacterized protein n=1 Tax=Algibacter mikhailovii TaxID=425498 RepID=A0A918R438_9FLAO|nr:hypothetical protein GCM10007028_20160 [Algibacter mikhailovii]